MNKDNEHLEEMDEEVVEMTAEQYQQYTKYQIAITICAVVFCTLFVGAITTVICTTGNDRLMWLYLIPALCYIFG